MSSRTTSADSGGRQPTSRKAGKSDDPALRATLDKLDEFGRTGAMLKTDWDSIEAVLPNYFRQYEQRVAHLRGTSTSHHLDFVMWLLKDSRSRLLNVMSAPAGQLGAFLHQAASRFLCEERGDPITKAVTDAISRYGERFVVDSAGVRLAQGHPDEEWPAQVLNDGARFNHRALAQAVAAALAEAAAAAPGGTGQIMKRRVLAAMVAARFGLDGPQAWPTDGDGKPVDFPAVLKPAHRAPDARVLASKVMPSLDPLAFAVLALIHDGLKRAAIASALGVTEKQVDQAGARGRRRLEQLVSDHEFLSRGTMASTLSLISIEYHRLHVNTPSAEEDVAIFTGREENALIAPQEKA